MVRLQTQLLAEFNPLAHSQSVPLFHLGPLVVTNHMLMVALAAGLLMWLFPRAVRSKELAPGPWHNAIEAVCEYFREQVARPMLHEHTDRYIGFIWTMFFFVLTMNLLGMVPVGRFVTLVSRRECHTWGAATSDIWVTGALALVSFVMTHACGIKHQGVVRYAASFTPPSPWWIRPFLFLTEMISTFIKPMSLAIRLFANIVAGHILLATCIGMIIIFKSFGVATASVAVTVALSSLDVLVAFIQAFIFAFLCALYISFSIAPQH